MSVNNIELYHIFIESISTNGIIVDLNKSDIKEFILNNTVNDLILKYKELTSISEVYEEKQILFRSIFYENVSDYIMKNNFHSIKNIKVIFILFSYISPNKMYLLIQYLYPLLDDNNKDYFHYEMLIIIYTVMINKSELNNLEYYELLNNLYKEKIIQNPLYSKNEEKEDEDYTYISLFDFFVHASYICEDCNVSIIFMKLMLNVLESLDNDKLMNFYSTSVNLDSLYTLYENIYQKNEYYIDMIERDEKKSNIYVNTFSYFVDKLFIYIKKHNDISKYILNTNGQQIGGENINDLIDYYYSKILYGENRKDNNYLKMDINFNSIESSKIIGDLFRVNNPIKYKIFIDSFNKSDNLSPISKDFMIIIWFRFIYFKINKYKNQHVIHDTIKNKYYIKECNREVILERSTYINDIITYMNKMRVTRDGEEYIYDFLIENIRQFVLYDYDNMRNKCYSCIDKSCSICLDEVNSDNINICYYCNKVFHDSCINELWRNNHDDCPLCRRAINNCFYTFSKTRYEFFKDILEGL